MSKDTNNVGKMAAAGGVIGGAVAAVIKTGAIQAGVDATTKVSASAAAHHAAGGTAVSTISSQFPNSQEIISALRDHKIPSFHPTGVGHGLQPLIATPPIQMPTTVLTEAPLHSIPGSMATHGEEIANELAKKTAHSATKTAAAHGANFFDTVGKFFSGFFGRLGSAFQHFWGPFSSAMGKLGAAIGNIFSSGGKAAHGTAALPAVGDALGKVAGTLGHVAPVAIGAGAAALGFAALAKLFGKHKPKVVDAGEIDAPGNARATPAPAPAQGPAR